MRLGFGRFRLRGDSTIVIARDRHGVPHVRATSEADLYRGLGFCHGFDRGLQMLLVRIVVQGRTAELLRDTDEMVALDRFFRHVNLAADTEVEADKLTPADSRIAAAYCDGVERAVRWPRALLRVLGATPEPWSIADSILLSRVVGYVSMAQSQGDVERLIIEMAQGGVPREHLRALFPALPPDLDVELLREVELGARLVPRNLGWTNVLPPALASNCWALAPRRTSTGGALLANDPHLDVGRLPGLWYEVVLELGDRYCIAATMPGLPGPLIGRNNDVAWGVTYSCMDAHDSWIEDCRDGRYRRVVDGSALWLEFGVRRELIRRKKSPPVPVAFYENDHGVLDGEPTTGLRLASRWSAGRATGARSLAAVQHMLHVRGAEEAMDTLGRIETSWNWIVADRNGAIGYQMSGLLPLRREGAAGLAPGRGWDPADDWSGFAAEDELPRALDPAAGFVVTANDDLHDLGGAEAINLPMGSDRARRITELLAGRDDWSARDAEAMLMDVRSKQAEAFMAVLRPLLPGGPGADVLRAWDCGYDADSRGAYVFERFYRRLVRAVFGGIVGDEVVSFLIEETGILAAYYPSFDRVLLDAGSVWYANESRDEVFARAAAEALAEPVATWGGHQRIVMRNMLFAGRAPAWLGLDWGPAPLRGGRATIHQGQVYRAGGVQATVAPSYRSVIDLAEDGARTTAAGGPSERPWSSHYKRGLPDWLAGRFKTLRPGPSRSSGS